MFSIKTLSDPADSNLVSKIDKSELLESWLVVAAQMLWNNSRKINQKYSRPLDIFCYQSKYEPAWLLYFWYDLFIWDQLWYEEILDTRFLVENLVCQIAKAKNVSLLSPIRSENGGKPLFWPHCSCNLPPPRTHTRIQLKINKQQFFYLPSWTRFLSDNLSDSW